jgi:beta-N-acetylhexosaminidase
VAGINGELKGSASLQAASSALLRAVLERAADKTVLVAMGNPYLAGEYPGVQTYLCTFSNVPVSEISAVRALFGEIPIGGRLPVTIPGVARRGEGIARPARRAQGDKNHVPQGKNAGR